MPFISVSQEDSSDIDLYYEDSGTGKPVILIHGWPLSCDSWEKQLPALTEAGYRVIAYDRRGFGNSSRPYQGYDYGRLARDLEALIDTLDLQQVALVGFSMGGGEVARYLGRHGSKRVKKAIFISCITPCLLKAEDNPEGLVKSVFTDIEKAILADRPAFLSGFLQDFFNADILLGSLVSEAAIQNSWNVAVGASAKATFDCVASWGTDFRKDLWAIDIPILVIHGDADRIVPIANAGARMKQAVKNARLVTIEGGPHGITWTHAGQVNRELLAFLER